MNIVEELRKMSSASIRISPLEELEYLILSHLLNLQKFAYKILKGYKKLVSFLMPKNCSFNILTKIIWKTEKTIENLLSQTFYAINDKEIKRRERFILDIKRENFFSRFSEKDEKYRNLLLLSHFFHTFTIHKMSAIRRIF